MNNPDLHREGVDELGEQTALSFLRWNYRDMMMDPMMIIDWSKYILSQFAVHQTKMSFTDGAHGWNWWRNCIKMTTLEQIPVQ